MSGTPVTSRRGPGGSVVVEVRGDVNVAATPQLRQELLRALLRGRPSRVVVDLANAGDMVSEGIGTVVAADQVASDRRVPMVVYGPSSEVADRLRRAGLPRVHIKTRTRWPNAHFIMWLV